VDVAGVDVAVAGAVAAAAVDVAVASGNCTCQNECGTAKEALQDSQPAGQLK